jgi:nicotinamidase-related amidase
MRIIREESVGVVIDIQEKLFPHISVNDELLRNISLLINGLKILDVPVILTEQYPAGLGKTVKQISMLLEGPEPVEKIAFSCCDEPRFMKKLEGVKKHFVILAGMETHVCVLQTCLDLMEKNYMPVVVRDCVSSRKPADREAALLRMQREGAIITSYESVLLELCRVAGTSTFKAISRLVK